jgi:hypothetical protein
MDSLPKIVYRREFSHLFGLITILYYIEDRRPDLPEYSGKYKNWLRVTIFDQEYRWTYRTDHLYDDSPATAGRTAWTGQED